MTKLQSSQLWSKKGTNIMMTCFCIVNCFLFLDYATVLVPSWMCSKVNTARQLSICYINTLINQHKVVKYSDQHAAIWLGMKPMPIRSSLRLSIFKHYYQVTSLTCNLMNADTNKHLERLAPCQCTANIWLFAQVFFSCFIRQLVLQFIHQPMTSFC